MRGANIVMPNLTPPQYSVINLFFNTYNEDGFFNDYRLNLT